MGKKDSKIFNIAIPLKTAYKLTKKPHLHTGRFIDDAAPNAKGAWPKRTILRTLLNVASEIADISSKKSSKSSLLTPKNFALTNPHSHEIS